MVVWPALLFLLPLPVLATGHCRVGSLGCHGHASCMGVTSSATSTNANATGSNSNSACKCCTGYPFAQHGECHWDCTRNSWLYLVQLQARMAFTSMGKCHAHPH